MCSGGHYSPGELRRDLNGYGNEALTKTKYGSAMDRAAVLVAA
jgi:hypothetical protein